MKSGRIGGRAEKELYGSIDGSVEINQSIMQEREKKIEDEE